MHKLLCIQKRWCKKGGQGSHSIMHTFVCEVLLSNTTTLLLEQEWLVALSLPPWLQNQVETNSWHYTLLKVCSTDHLIDCKKDAYTTFTMSWQTISDHCMLKDILKSYSSNLSPDFTTCFIPGILTVQFLIFYSVQKMEGGGIPHFFIRRRSYYFLCCTFWCSYYSRVAFITLESSQTSTTAG